MEQRGFWVTNRSCGMALTHVVNKHVNAFCCFFSFSEDASVMETGRS